VTVDPYNGERLEASGLKLSDDHESIHYAKYKTPILLSFLSSHLDHGISVPTGGLLKVTRLKVVSLG
jgi:hypothetical protein